MFCYGFKTIDLLCEMEEFVADEVLQEMIKSKCEKFDNLITTAFKFADMDAFVENVENIFKVSVDFNDRFEFQTNSSKSIRRVHAEVVEEIYGRTQRIFKLFKFTDVLVSIFLLWMVVK